MLNFIINLVVVFKLFFLRHETLYYSRVAKVGPLTLILCRGSFDAALIEIVFHFYKFSLVIVN